MKQKYRINLAHWSYVRGMQHIFSLKYYIKRNQDIRRNIKRCHHTLHLMIASERRLNESEAKRLYKSI